MAEAETALDIHLELPRKHAHPSANLPIRQYSLTPDCQTPTNRFSATVDSQRYARECYGDDDGPPVGPGAVGLAESNSSSSSSRGKLDATAAAQESYQQQQQQRSFLPAFDEATVPTCDGRPPLVGGHDSDVGGDSSTPSAHRATCNTARRPTRTEQSALSAGRHVPRHGDGSGDHGERINAAVEEAASAIAVEDIAIVQGPTSVPSPIEHVLARRKRRRRANFSVSSALWLSASAEGMLLPPAPVRLPFSSLQATEEEDKRDSAPGGNDDLESGELR